MIHSEIGVRVRELKLGLVVSSCARSLKFDVGVSGRIPM